MYDVKVFQNVINTTAEVSLVASSLLNPFKSMFFRRKCIIFESPFILVTSSVGSFE
ncbi:hypothetical protein [Teredinibacter haidensis]|uniref:hypothetical protein n=1 Tax=Teredinibacter haidensis TaxID=2731755 RepID=UPI000A793C50|nr:hypothetical protein [Teredinibacter haidensis]